MLFFCELYVIRDELALLGRTAHHPRSWASTSYNYTWARTSYNYTIGPGPVPAITTTTSYQPMHRTRGATKAVWQMGASTCTEHTQQKQTSE